jgi:hypothetical protein
MFVRLPDGDMTWRNLGFIRKVREPVLLPGRVTENIQTGRSERVNFLRRVEHLAEEYLPTEKNASFEHLKLHIRRVVDLAFPC